MRTRTVGKDLQEPAPATESLEIKNEMTAAKKLTLKEWERLSQWPLPQDDRTAMDDLAGMRELLGALLKRYKRLLFESTTASTP
jgi:hypothetical protein